jgi:dihydroorotate dehydrogenase (fumarate)
MSLKTKIGNIHLNSCLFNASGVYCKSKKELSNLNKSNSTGAILTKSCTLELRVGNDPPIYWDDGKENSINSSGLPNMGFKYYVENEDIIKYNKPYFVSISGMCEQDNLTIVREVINNKSISGIELNLSCPNIEGKPQIGYDFQAMKTLISKVDLLICNMDFKHRNNFNFGVKLPPYFDISHFKLAANIINNSSINTITCVNSLGNGLIIDPILETVVIKPKGGHGGIGGSVIKSIALSNVRQFSLLTNCDIIGCGGIMSGIDAFEHILCGAKAIQIGTKFYMGGIDVFTNIEKELLKIMHDKNYKTINDFCGKLKEL